MKWIALLVSVSTLLAAPPEGKQKLSAPQLNALGLEFFQQARYSEAESAYRRSLAEWSRLGLNMSLSRAVTAGNLGTLLQVEGRYSEAETLLADSLQQVETASGAATAETARAAQGLASLYLAWGRPETAEAYAKRACAAWDGLPDDPAERRAARRLLASVFLAEHRFEEGEGLLRPLLPDLPERTAVGAYNDLAVAETNQGHVDQAQSLAAKALELARQAFPAAHPLIAVSLNNLAQAERFQGHYLDAESHYRDAIEIWKQAFGRRHPDVAKGLMNLAAFYHDRGREAGAEDLYRQAAGIFEASYGKDGPLTLVTRNELGEVLRAQGRFTESERLSRDTLGQLETTLPARDPRVVRALGNYARLLDQTSHARDAAAVRQRIQTLEQGFRENGQ